MNKDILFSLWYDSLEGTKSQGFAYKAWCAGWSAAQKESTLQEISDIGREIEQAPVVYQCPRCATSMEVDLSAKPLKREQAEKQTSAAKFWQGVYPDGWTAERVKAEMTDYYNLLDGMDSLIDYVTGGAISKPLTDKSVIRMKHDEHVNKMIEEAIQEATLQEMSDIGQEIERGTTDMAHRSGGLSVKQAENQEPEHWSDCAIYNEPAYHKGECNCGGYYKPIAYKEKKSDSIFYDKNNCSGDYIPLYTAPPKREWVGLTDEEIDYLEDAIDPAMYRVFARRIEAKLKEKNT